MSRNNFLKTKTMKKFITILGTILFVSSTLTSCVNNSSGFKSSKQSQVDSIDGIYKGTQNLGGIVLAATLTIHGNTWSAKSQLGSESPEYYTGVVKGSDLYDKSGMLKIGYVSGKTARMNGYPSMSK